MRVVREELAVAAHGIVGPHAEAVLLREGIVHDATRVRIERIGLRLRKRLEVQCIPGTLIEGIMPEQRLPDVLEPRHIDVAVECFLLLLRERLQLPEHLHPACMHRTDEEEVIALLLRWMADLLLEEGRAVDPAVLRGIHRIEGIDFREKAVDAELIREGRDTVPVIDPEICRREARRQRVEDLIGHPGSLDDHDLVDGIRHIPECLLIVAVHQAVTEKLRVEHDELLSEAVGMDVCIHEPDLRTGLLEMCFYGVLIVIEERHDQEYFLIFQSVHDSTCLRYTVVPAGRGRSRRSSHGRGPCRLPFPSHGQRRQTGSSSGIYRKHVCSG